MAAPAACCVVLVPAFTPPVPRCEEALRELERRGYPVRRVRGFSAVDQGRNQMVSDALHDGFAETMWIDPDIVFEAAAVERLRAHNLPIVAGLYPQPGLRALACHLLPQTQTLLFGAEGGLVEIGYAAAGFLHVRREAYERIREHHRLPLCNTRFGRGIWPFFMPLVVETPLPAPPGELPAAQAAPSLASNPAPSGSAPSPPPPPPPTRRYLTEDYAFCHRARQAGMAIMADTTIRLSKMGPYGYGWEDAGSDPPRYDTFHYHVDH
jgi:hypothetical protein